MLKHRDGRVAHIETQYSDIYVDKNGPLLSLATKVRSCCQSIVNLKDPDDMPLAYARIMPAALLYPDRIKRMLLIGLGAGSISTFLGRAMPG